MPGPIFFTPGPSQLYHTVPEHIKTALKESIPSISHRSSQFQNIFATTRAHLKELFDLPDSYEIFFAGSATEIWERLIQNLVVNESLHLVNGSFSKRFQQISSELGRHSISVSCSEGLCVKPDELPVDAKPELLAITLNETSTGAMQTAEEIKMMRSQFPEAILALDVVSILPAVPFDMSLVDTAYLSVQKCFGLPAGLGVWIVNQKCLERQQQLKGQGLSTGSYHQLSALKEQGDKNQTPETPNVLGIFLLGKVAEDMLKAGKEMMHRDTRYKAAVLYQAISKNELLEPFVEHRPHQSLSTIVAKTVQPSSLLIQYLKTKHLMVGSGYGPFKDQHIRIANFPAHSRESIEMIADFIQNWEGK